MHEIRTTAIENAGVYQVCHASELRCAKKAELIDDLFGMKTSEEPRNSVLDEDEGREFDAVFAKLL